MSSDLQRFITAVKKKSTLYKKYWQYYEGKQPLIYSSSRLAEVFGGITARFTENWIEAVVDMNLDKLELTNFLILGNEEAQKKLADLWVSTELVSDEDDIEAAMLVTGEAYVIAWVDEEETVEAFYNSPSMTHLFYKADNPKKPAYGGKVWRTDKKQWRVNLYYPDKIVYYISPPKKTPGFFVSAKSYKPFNPPGVSGGEAVNRFGTIPIFHFSTNGRYPKSMIGGLIEAQDAINKLSSDMMVTSEFGSFKQRYVVTNADLSDLSNTPGKIWEIPMNDGEGENTQVGEFGAAVLQDYLLAIDRKVTFISVKSRVPKHYLHKQAGDPSGEALIASEAPLNRRATKLINKRLKPAYTKLASFLLQLTGEKVTKDQIVPMFAPPETIQPLTKAQTAQALSTVGASPYGAAKVAGYTEREAELLQEVDQGTEQ